MVGSGVLRGGVLAEAAGEVGVGEEGDAEGDEVGAAVGEGGFGLGLVEAAVGDEGGGDQGAEGGCDVADLDGSGVEVGPGGLHEVEVGEAEGVQLGDDVSEGGVGAAVVHARLAVGGGELDADAVGAPDAGHGLGDVQHEAGAVLDAAAVAVGAVIAGVLQELVGEVAERAVQLHAVEPGRQGVACGVFEVLDDGGISAVSRARGVG